MNAFLIDLWNDLREKRLWPVAALLLLGLIAVPIALSEPSKEPASATVVAVSPPSESGATKGLAALTVAKDDTGDGSSLDVFDSSNPFKPPQDIIANSDESTDAGPASESGGGDTSSTATAGGGGSGTTGDSGGGTTPAPTGDETKTVEYRYVIDATFTANGDKRKIKGMERLEVLPSQANPLLIFLGASKNGANAVFLVDSTLTAAGEGKCKPSNSDCAFLYLGAGSEHQLTNDEGDSYTLRVDQIRKVRAGDDASPAKGSKSAKRADGHAATARVATGSEPAARRFVPPLITDLLSVSSGSEEPSDDGQTGR